MEYHVIFMFMSYSCGSHRFEKYLNMKGFPKSPLKLNVGELLSGLEKYFKFSKLTSYHQFFSEVVFPESMSVNLKFL